MKALKCKSLKSIELEEMNAVTFPDVFMQHFYFFPQQHASQTHEHLLAKVKELIILLVCC